MPDGREVCARCGLLLEGGCDCAEPGEECPSCGKSAALTVTDDVMMCSRCGAVTLRHRPVIRDSCIKRFGNSGHFTGDSSLAEAAKARSAHRVKMIKELFPHASDEALRYASENLFRNDWP